jgi:hypothetical protein
MRVVSYYRDMKAQDIQIGSAVQFDEYGTGTHNGTVLSVTGTGGSGNVVIGSVEPPLGDGKTTTTKMAAFCKPASECPPPNPNAGKGNQSDIRNYVNKASSARGEGK